MCCLLQTIILKQLALAEKLIFLTDGAVVASGGRAVFVPLISIFTVALSETYFYFASYKIRLGVVCFKYRNRLEVPVFIIWFP